MRYSLHGHSFKGSLLSGSIAVALVAVSPVASAQDAAAASPAAGPAQSGLDEIIVTATRREERLQKVPVAVTALTGNDLEQKSIKSMLDLQRFVPAVSFQTSAVPRNQDIIAIRGQIPFDVQLNVDQPVGLYLNDIVESRATGLASDLYDMESVQVLRGPQGTLFGRNTTGGAILFYSKKPGPDYDGYAKVTLGNYNTRDGEGAVNLPLNETLSLRIAFSAQNRDGYVDNVAFNKELGGVNSNAWRASLLWRPNDSFSNLFVNDGYFLDTTGSPTVLRACGTPAGGLSFLGAVCQAALPKVGDYTTSWDQPGFQKASSVGFSDIATYDLTDALTIKNLFGMRHVTTSDSTDIDGAALGIIGDANQNLRDDQLSEELQLQGTTLSDALKYTAGLYYFREHGTDISYAHVLPILGPSGQAYLVGGAPANDSYSAYAQGTYTFPSLPDLSVTAGIRYTVDDRYFTAQSHLTVPPFTCRLLSGNEPGAAPLSPCVHVSSANFSAPTFTTNVNYQWDPGVMTYVSISRGYKTGGIQNRATTPAEFTPFDDEFVLNYEAGIKADFSVFGMPARVNVSGYYDDYSNIQVVNTIVENGALQNLINNVASGEVYGGELEVTLKPIPSLTLKADFAPTIGRFTGGTIGGVDQTGHHFARTPDYSGAVSAAYVLPTPEDWGPITVSGDMYAQTGVIWSIASGAGGTSTNGQGAYALTNFRIDWAGIMGSPIDAGFFVTNAFNKHYFVGGLDEASVLGDAEGVVGPPRFFGVDLTYHFGGAKPTEEAAAPYTPPPAVAPLPSVPKSYLVFFDFNKSDLTPQAVMIVNQAAANAGPAKVTQLTVTGHTDTVGSDAYNMRLSRRRAESVAAQLEKDGIPSSEIAIVAKGKRDLLVPTADGVKEPQNRRVQIVYDGGPTT